MPVYAYQCDKKHQFETKQSIHEEPLKKCPTCGAECKKLLFPVGFHLSGPGWAKDGYSSSVESKKKGKK